MGATLSLFGDIGPEKEKPKKKAKVKVAKSVVASTAPAARLTLADVQQASVTESAAPARKVQPCLVTGCTAPTSATRDDERALLCEAHRANVPGPMWYLEKLAYQSGNPKKIKEIFDRIVRAATGGVIVKVAQKADPVAYDDGRATVQNPYDRLLPKTKQMILSLPNEVKIIRTAEIKDEKVREMVEKIDRTGRTSMIAHVKVVDDEIDLVFRAQVAASLARNGAIMEAERLLGIKTAAVADDNEQDPSIEEVERSHAHAPPESLPLTDEQWEDLEVSRHKFRRASSRTMWLARGREILRRVMSSPKRSVFGGMKRLLSAEPDKRGNMFDPETGEVLSGPDSLLPSAERSSVPR